MSADVKPYGTVSLKVGWEVIAPYQGFACDSPKVYLCSAFWRKVLLYRAPVCAPAKGEKGIREREVIRLYLITLAST